MNMDDINYQAFLQGDINGFENLVIDHKDHLIYFINRYIKNIDYAEDIAQDAFVEVYVHKDRYHIGKGFKTYLYTIGRNKAVDFIRKNQKHVLVDAIPEQADEVTLEQKVLEKEDKLHLHRLISELKEDYRDALYLIDFEDLSYEDAAHILHRNLPQMKILIYRARKALKKLVERERDNFEG